MPRARGGMVLNVLEEIPAGMAEPCDDLRDREEWLLALRIAASKGLSKSEFLPRFLLYVCEQHLQGHGREMTEQHLGVQVFNRPLGYNPGEDNIVRSYARMLRKRLDEYFEGEGQDEPLRLEIPRGGYVPVFYLREEPAAVPERPVLRADVEPGGLSGQEQGAAREAELREMTPTEGTIAAGAATTERPMTLNAPAMEHAPVSAMAERGWGWSLLMLVAVALLAWVGLRVWHPGEGRRHEGPAHALWAQLFRSDRNTLIVPADSGLGILQNLTGHLVSLEEYTNGTYLSEMKPPAGISPENLNDLRRQRYTSVVDLNIASTLTQLPEFNPTRSSIRYARSVTTEDLKSSNAILLGSVHTNPWVSLFEGKLNFVLRYTPEVNQSYVVNKQPLAGEQATYKNGDDGVANKTYGLVDYLPGLGGGDHVLIVQGLNMAGTQAAAEVLGSEELMRPVLQEATKPDGTLCAFELLVQTSSIGASAPEPRVVGMRVDRGR